MSKRKHEDEKKPKSKSKRKKNTQFIVPSVGLLKQKAKFSFWKGVDYFYEDAISDVEAKLEDGDMTLTGQAKGSKKKVYEVELQIPQDEAKLKKKGWTGTCTCDNSSKSACSHQIALILEWDDQRRLNEGVITKSDKETFKKAASVDKTFTKKQRTEFSKHKEDLVGCSVDTLKKMLRLNDQVTTGNKGALIDRAAECMVVGAVTRCPQCGGGRPKFQSGFYYCPGYMDDDKFKNCNWMSRDLDRTPWKQEEDS